MYGKVVVDVPKVSICVPAYGNPEGIARLLKSVREQSFTDYEVVLTDDSADDGVKAAAESAGIEKLIYHKNESRLGATANWNEAVRRSCGEYIKLMHHDDWFSQADSLERFVHMLEEAPEAVLAFCGTWQVTLKTNCASVPAGGRPQKAAADPKSGDDGETPERFARGISPEHEVLIRRDWRNLFLGNYIGAPSATIYRRNGLEYETALTWLVDMEYYMRLLQKRPEFVCTADPLICIGISGSQLTESCKGDGALNVFEYGFLFREFLLGKEKTYRDKLIGVALSYGQPYGALSEYGITKEEYQVLERIKKKEDRRALLGAVKRKIFGKQK